MFIIFASLGVFVHEVLGHFLTAILLGCTAKPSTMILIGATQFQCVNAAAIKNITIALAGPTISFIFGLALWFVDKDSIIRFAGLVVMFYSVIPSLAPFIPQSDMAYALSQGFNPLIGWFIFILLGGIISKEALAEIREKELF